MSERHGDGFVPGAFIAQVRALRTTATKAAYTTPQPYAAHGERLLARRQALALTLEAVARKSPWNVRFMSRLAQLERGEDLPDADELAFLRHLYTRW